MDRPGVRSKEYNITYLDKSCGIVQRQSVPQYGLDKDAQGKDMHPDHDAFTPTSPSHAQGFAADLALFIGHTIQLSLFFFAAAFDIFVLTRCPLLLSTLMDKLGAVLLESHDGKQRKLIIMVDLHR